MAQLYRIKPLDKKSVEFFIDVYEDRDDNIMRGFTVTETYRWGQGFREIDDPVYDTETDCVRCNPGVGWGCELDDSVNIYVEFQGDFTDDEQEEIKQFMSGERQDEDGRYGATWLFEGEHNWLIEDDCVNIIGPVQIDIVDDDQYNVVIEENVKPLTYEPTGWPSAK